MSSPDSPTEPLTPPQEPRRLTRSSTDLQLGGVAGGLGRYFGIDPIIFRIGFVVLTFAGGAGLLAYVALWLFVPDDGGSTVSTQDRGRALTIAAAVAFIVIAALIFADNFFFGPGLLGLALFVGLGVLIFQLARSGDARPAVVRALLIFATLAGAATLGVAAAIGTAFGGGTLIAFLVIGLGATMVVGAFTKGRRWLLIPALALAAPVAFVAAADIEIDGGMGERTYRPATLADVRDRYELGVGEMWIDLRRVQFPSGRTTVAVDQGVGEANVLVPEDVCVSADLEVGIGAAELFGRENGGVEIDVQETPSNPARAPQLHVIGDLDLGAMRIGHDLDFDRHRFFGPRFGPGFDDDLDIDDQPACLETA